MTVRRTMLGLFVVVVELLAASPVQAHEGEGVLSVESATVEDQTARYVVRLIWKNDRHPAVDATLTATTVAPDGTAGTPVTLEPVDRAGRYEGTVSFTTGGTWTVRFTSVTPAATIEREEVIRATATTSSTLTITTRPDEPEAASPTAEADDDNGGLVGMLAAALLALIVISAVTGIVRSVRRRGEGA